MASARRAWAAGPVSPSTGRRVGQVVLKGIGAILRIVALLTAALFASQAIAQKAPPPLPDKAEMTRLIWSTLIAVDHANRTGNYSVLRDLAAPGFQTANNPARLAQIFANLRTKDIGLRRVVLAAPVLDPPPKMRKNGMLEVRGRFDFRPQAINFALLFQSVGGDWKLFGVLIRPVDNPVRPVAKPQRAKDKAAKKK